MENMAGSIYYHVNFPLIMFSLQVMETKFVLSSIKFLFNLEITFLADGFEEDLIKRLEQPWPIGGEVWTFTPGLPCWKCAPKQLVSSWRDDRIDGRYRPSDADRSTRSVCARRIHFLPDKAASRVNRNQEWTREIKSDAENEPSRIRQFQKRLSRTTIQTIVPREVINIVGQINRTISGSPHVSLRCIATPLIVEHDRECNLAPGELEV